MESFRRITDIAGTSVDGVGVFIVVGGALIAKVRLVVRRAHGAERLREKLKVEHAGRTQSWNLTVAVE